MKLKPLPKMLWGKKTYNQISEEYGLSYVQITKRVRKLQIKGICFNNQKFFTPSQVKKIIAFGDEDARTQSRNIFVIEYYLKGFGGVTISRLLGMSTNIVFEVIKEYNDTGCITVHSKIDKVTFPNKEKTKKLKIAA